ncbi:MAG: hypothetical protein MN733_14675 [Nitrososphaera sp.]|nr:hypothetical protein [Nitrososphaera sp.]
MGGRRCEICKKEIIVSSPDLDELCITCGNEFREMMIALVELSSEMANAYKPKKQQGSSKNQTPGIPIEELVLRMELNRIKNRK